jgi:hypothetical protein
MNGDFLDFDRMPEDEMADIADNTNWDYIAEVFERYLPFGLQLVAVHFYPSMNDMMELQILQHMTKEPSEELVMQFAIYADGCMS